MRSCGFLLTCIGTGKRNGIGFRNMGGGGGVEFIEYTRNYQVAVELLGYDAV
jgi:hypothetical protein